MDQSSVRHIRETTNIDVTEAPTAQHLVKQYLTSAIIGMTLITSFMIVALGYNPFGCKTQFLFNSTKYWYNKQIAIIILIYFVVVINQGKASALTAPIAKFTITLIIWIGFNILLSLGGIWAMKHPQPWWPGPIDWFGVVILQMISLFIVNDTKKYYKAVAPSGGYGQALNILGYLEDLFIITILGSTGLGFYKAVRAARKRIGPNFRIWRLLFGVPVKGEEGKGCRRHFPKFRKELGSRKGHIRWGPEALLYPFALIIGTLGIVHFITAEEAAPRIM